jgi:transposase InsO family protein
VALKVVSMDELRLELLLEPERTGDSVAEVCRRRGVSRASFYRYRARYLQEGEAGLVPRSRAPRRSPGQIDPQLEAMICALRRRRPRWGARRIRAELLRAGVDAPAVSTVNRALKRNHLIAPQPPRKAKANLRFERAAANDLWQIDATQVPLAAGGHGWAIDVLDDHARYLLAIRAGARATGELAWESFTAAASLHGTPRQVLSDNGTIFTGRLLGHEVAFERKLAALGIQLINAAPAHPQTLGKLERFHRTMKEWLTEEGPAADLEHLQLLLERFQTHYNTQRPHQALGDLTPAERYTPGAAPAVAELASAEPRQDVVYPPHTLTRKVSRTGVFSFAGLAIALPIEYVGAHVRIIETGELLHVYLDQQLIRVLAPDYSKRYQPLGNHRRRGF